MCALQHRVERSAVFEHGGADQQAVGLADAGILKGVSVLRCVTRNSKLKHAALVVLVLFCVSWRPDFEFWGAQAPAVAVHDH